MITHTNFESKKRITFYWTAPKAGTGCISFKYYITYIQKKKKIYKILSTKEHMFCKQKHYGLKMMVNWPKQFVKEVKFEVNLFN